MKTLYFTIPTSTKKSYIFTERILTLMMASCITSIIIPAYNSSSRIESTLKSIISQSCPEYEIIIVNDGSTDSTEETARKFLEEHNCRFQIIRHEKNLGVSAARNTGLKAAQGQYIWFVDADDIADEKFLSTLREKVVKENADIVLGGYKIYFETRNYTKYRRIKLSRELPSARDYFPAWCLRKIPSNIWSCLFRKKFIEDNALSFPEGCHSGEDEEFLVKALISSRKTCFVEELLYTQVSYEKHPDVFKPNRPEWYSEEGSPKPQYRAVRYILRHSSNKRERSYAVSLYLSWAIMRQFKISARRRDKANYEKHLRKLKHRKIREVLFSTTKFFFRQPETPFKALMLLLFPKTYYFLKR